MSSSLEDLPLLCEVCLGGNPFVRMERLPFGVKSCSFSRLPFQAFRWRPQLGRFKVTVVSRDVAAERNICQCCLNDLQFGLPAAVRDAALRRGTSEVAKLPMNEVEHLNSHTNTPGLRSDIGPQDTAGVALLGKVARRPVGGEVAFRNLPKLCTFWLAGQCRRASTGRCPFRPCCGVFVFPEVARDKDLGGRLVAALEQQGPAAAQTSLDKDIRSALKDSLRGNHGEAIRKRLRGEDDLTQQGLARIREMVRSSSALLAS